MMTKTAERVAAEMAASELVLVDVANETRTERFVRVDAALRRLDIIRSGFDVWTDEYKAIGEQYRRVYAFRAFGTK
jgi:hypothetical protein